MSKISLERYSKITNAFMVADAKFGGHDIPKCLCTAKTLPDELIAYCDIKKGVKALEKLMQCVVGVITPDFSTWQDDPEPIKLYNTYRMRALAHNNGFSRHK